MKILIADDSLHIQSRLFKMLSKIPEITDIFQARNTTDTITIFRKSTPDTVILDISMPTTSGIDVLETMKEERPQTKIIVFTNYPSKQFKTVCNNLDADFFFVKSDDFYEIPRAIKEIIKKSKK